MSVAVYHLRDSTLTRTGPKRTPVEVQNTATCPQLKKHMAPQTAIYAKELVMELLKKEEILLPPQVRITLSCFDAQTHANFHPALTAHNMTKLSIEILFSTGIKSLHQMLNEQLHQICMKSSHLLCSFFSLQQSDLCRRKSNVPQLSQLKKPQAMYLPWNQSDWCCQTLPKFKKSQTHL